MGRSIRLDYDKIAHLYDSQPYRAKSPDPELSAFIREHPARGPISVLDIASGTGNQLIANRAVAPEARLVGADASFGMFRQACAKAPDIAWIRADATALPLSSRTFDFVGCQFAFHHFQDKRRMLAEGFRLLRPGGRLVLHNMCPEECPDWIYYRYFPAARGADARDFWPVAKVTTAMTQIGFVAVQVQYEHVRSERDLSHWLLRLRRRDICSQLQAIPDAEYKAGLLRLEAELADPAQPRTRADHLCLVTIRADKG